MRWLLPLALAASITGGMACLQIGFLVIGGNLVDFEQSAVSMARSAMRTRVGQRPAELTSDGVTHTVRLAWRELIGGKEGGNLAQGIQVLFKQPRYFAQYKMQIAGGVTLSILGSFLIAGLFVNRARRKRPEKESTRLASVVNHEQTRLEEVMSNVPGVVWELKLGPGDARRVEFVSGYIEKMLGYRVDELSVPLVWFSIIPDEDRDAVAKDAEEKLASGNESIIECRCKTKDGRLLRTESHLTRVSDEAGRLTGVRGLTLDITGRRQAEDDLRESEHRFRSIADTAPVMICVLDPDNLCTYVNLRWLEFTGRSIEMELGTGWTGSIHPDDIERFLETHTKARNDGRSFTIEFRVRRFDGKFRWIYESGTPWHSPAGKFLGYIGSRIDITERKTVEEALANFGGQLIRARDEEYARIARELHDDLNQRMALISVELDYVSQNPPSADKLRTKLENVMSRVAETSKAVHRMSYELHPSKLVHLGLVAALQSLFEELNRRHRLAIEFTNKDVPADLPQDLSLCLYRIAQECLSNVIKHSGVQQAKVDLLGTGNDIQLRVSDAGRGFAEPLKASNGLGLISMRERLRLAGGRISVESRPLQGTTIDVIVPLTQVSSNKNGPSTRDKSAAESRPAARHLRELLESTGVSRAPQNEEREQGP